MHQILWLLYIAIIWYKKVDLFAETMLVFSKMQKLIFSKIMTHGSSRELFLTS